MITESGHQKANTKQNVLSKKNFQCDCEGPRVCRTCHQEIHLRILCGKPAVYWTCDDNFETLEGAGPIFACADCAKAGYANWYGSHPLRPKRAIRKNPAEYYWRSWHRIRQVPLKNINGIWKWKSKTYYGDSTWHDLAEPSEALMAKWIKKEPTFP